MSKNNALVPAESKEGDGTLVRSERSVDTEYGESKRAENPFQMPSDDQVFLLREKEKRVRQGRREKLKNMSIWEKTQEMTKRKGVSRRSLDTDETDLISSSATALTAKPKKQSLATAASTAISSERRREKENMTDFIAKKREMFLVQMSLDTKREEIRKLEEKAQLKEEALRKSELMLEEDAIRFDTFLKENDKKAHEAIKKAETETKLKQDKLQEIKKLNHQIQAVQADMTKLKEQLEDCLKYKQFLDELTPPEWFKHQERIRKRELWRMQRAYKRKMIREYEEERRRILDEYEEAKRKEEARSAGRSRTTRKDNSVNIPPPKLPEMPKFPFVDVELDERDLQEEEAMESKQRGIDEDSDDDGENEEKEREIEDELAERMEELLQKGLKEPEEEMPMYFTEPSQLLNIFTQLEESNLFLIQNSQETEQALEELKQEFQDTKQRMDVKTDSLKANIDELDQQIQSEKGKAHILKSQIASNMGEDAQERLLRELNDKVKEVYKKCGFDCDASPSTLSMLTDLEARLEDLLSQIEQMPEEYVIKAEKLKEKERRERVRVERLDQQKLLYEERLRKSIERSMQAPKKKTGKPVMFRSAPPQKKVRKRDNSAAEEKAQDMKEFFSW